MESHPEPNRERAQHSALEAILNGRTELAETRLAVTAVQIIERLRIRAKNLKQLLDEELSIDNKLLQIQGQFPPGFNKDLFGIEAQLDQRVSQVQSSQRREDVECWRDLTNVMRDFLNAWESFSRNEARNRFMSALPQQALPGLDSVTPVNQLQAYSMIHNDNPITSYTPQYRLSQGETDLDRLGVGEGIVKIKGRLPPTHVQFQEIHVQPGAIKDEDLKS